MDLVINYIVEDNFDFYKELYNEDDVVVNDGDNSKINNDDNICLISKLALDHNHISLPCNHKFNFIPLYNEIKSQKVNVNRLETSRLYICEIKCPYCRTIHSKLLPHIVLNSGMNYIIGVNTPKKYCMDFHTCSYVFKCGNRKNTTCSDTAYYSDIGCYCKRHTCYVSEHEGNVDTTVVYCSAIVKSGKRKGTECNCKVTKKSPTLCSRHYREQSNNTHTPTQPS